MIHYRICVSMVHVQICGKQRSGKDITPSRLNATFCELYARLLRPIDTYKLDLAHSVLILLAAMLNAWIFS